MNKYEKAFEHLRKHASFDTVDEMIDIKELVERATPKRPYVRGFNPDAGYPESGFYCCPNCCERIAWFDLSNEKRDYNINHCFYCGQALDWRVEDEKI